MGFVKIPNTERILPVFAETKVRLIPDAVTGKIDVRGIEIPEYEFAEGDIDKGSNENIETAEGKAYEE
ncbi:MAG: hypothetical protein HDR21_04425 [Lachnospiraceae bacterium]|nr:hypothetical protein [Lachnospiraceae bacterium]MBD5482664.1 hypothetical protein [Lachnospiraceae bacterium]